MADKIRAHDPLIMTILTLLAEKSRHPYELQRLIRERQKDFALVPPRSLYHAIDRLQAAGLVEPLETSREGKRPERTVYQITEEGREELETWLTEMLANPAKEYPAFMVALSLLPILQPEATQSALRARVARLEGEVAGLRATLNALAPQLPRLVLLEVEHTLVLRQAELDWVRMVIEDIRTGQLPWDFSMLQEKQ